MIIRQETERDFPILYDFVKTAFRTAKVSNGREQELVNRLRSGRGYIPELALLAEKDGILIGQFMLTGLRIDTGASPFEFPYIAPRFYIF
jgi:putative acetyltransferase